MKTYLLQNQDSVELLESQYFEPAYWVGKPGYQAIAGGRGGSVRIQLGDDQVILRHYYRGGLVRKLFTDQYLWLGKHRSRPWREWQILLKAQAAGLPVPEPVAACVTRTGFYYHAAIMTRYLVDTQTLAERLANSLLEPGDWYQLGLVIKRLHVAGIRHADLNASNILVDSANRFYIIDFDRARLVKRLDDWQWRPLYRLQRSLNKYDRNQGIHYYSDDWQALMDGYQAKTA